MLAMGITSPTFDLLDLRPSDLGSWIEGSADADALVLDLDDPRLASAAVLNLRRHGKTAPVLLVASHRPGWDDDQLLHLPQARVLPLRATRPVLVAHLTELLSAPPAVPPVAEAAVPLAGAGVDVPRPSTRREKRKGGAHRRTQDALDELVTAPDLMSEDDDLEARMRGQRGTPTETLSDVAPTPWPAPPTTDPLWRTTPTLPAPLGAIPRRQRSAAVPTRSQAGMLEELRALRESSVPSGEDRAGEHSRIEEPSQALTAFERGGVLDLVRALRARIGDLYGVGETGEVIVTDAVARTGADAAALMVPDDGVWRVAAGVGLRPLETRYELDHSAWLVDQVAGHHRGMIVEESDVAREHLQRAPLASWRHLIAAPLGQARSLMLVARRDDPAFGVTELDELARLCDEAGPLLAAALDTRALARELATFRD
jgi:hypothetical protein